MNPGDISALTNQVQIPMATLANLIPNQPMGCQLQTVDGKFIPVGMLEVLRVMKKYGKPLYVTENVSQMKKECTSTQLFN